MCVTSEEVTSPRTRQRDAPVAVFKPWLLSRVHLFCVIVAVFGGCASFIHAVTCCMINQRLRMTSPSCTSVYSLCHMTSHLKPKSDDESIQQTALSDTSSLSLGNMFAHYQEHTKALPGHLCSPGKCSYFLVCVCVLAPVTHAHKIFPLGLTWIGMASHVWTLEEEKTFMKCVDQIKQMNNWACVMNWICWVISCFILKVALHFLLPFSHSFLFMCFTCVLFFFSSFCIYIPVLPSLFDRLWC